MNDNVSNSRGDDVTTLLIADDDGDILELVHRGLSASGYEILLARDGTTALATAREQKPALVLLDVAMPSPDGYEVTSALKNDPATKDIVVILFTARSEASDVEKGYAAGADDYIIKPFTLNTLQSRVRAALDK
jgi:DNA-binding response OmpR family regulator